MAAGHYYDDLLSKRSMALFGSACLVVAALSVVPAVPYAVFDSVVWLLYAWAFLHLFRKAGDVRWRLVLVALIGLNALDAAYRVFGLDVDLLWGERDLLIEACWAVYLACAAFIAWTLLHTVEKPFLPRADVTFQRFLDAYGLSGREGEIVKLLMDGEPNQGICNRLYIAPGTVKAHNHSIYKKLGIKSRSHVVLTCTEFVEKCAQDARLFC